MCLQITDIIHVNKRGTLRTCWRCSAEEEFHVLSLLSLVTPNTYLLFKWSHSVSTHHKFFNSALTEVTGSYEEPGCMKETSSVLESLLFSIYRRQVEAKARKITNMSCIWILGWALWDGEMKHWDYLKCVCVHIYSSSLSPFILYLAVTLSSELSLNWLRGLNKLLSAFVNSSF